MRNRQKGWWRILHMSALFILKMALNHGKRYSELPRAIPCNILKYSLIFHCPGSHYRMLFDSYMSHRAPLHILSFACRSYVSTKSFVWWGFASSWRSIWFFQWCKAWVSILCARVVAIHYCGALTDGGERATYHDPLWTRNPYGIWPGTN